MPSANNTDSPPRDAVIEIVERFRLLPEACVDCSFRQGRDAVRRQLERRSGHDENPMVDSFIQDIHDTLLVVVKSAGPHHLALDYIFFLEYYGGLSIQSDHHYFQTLGVGPMVEDWYASVVSDAALPDAGARGFLSLGSLSFRAGKYKNKRVNFFLDFAGTIAEHAVFGIGPWGPKTITPLDVIAKPLAHTNLWTLLAHSFTEWLELATKTQGMSDSLTDFMK